MSAPIVEGSKLINGLTIYEVAGQPTTAPGVQAVIGCIALVNDGGTASLWQKTGPLATDWTAVNEGGGGITGLANTVAFYNNAGNISSNANFAYDVATGEFRLGPALSPVFDINQQGRVLTTGASVNKAVRLVSSDYSVNAMTDRTILVDTTTQAVTVSLPTGVDGQEFYIKDAGNNASTNAITIVPAAGQSFEYAAPNEVISNDGSSRHIQFFNGSWYILNLI